MNYNVKIMTIEEFKSKCRSITLEDKQNYENNRERYNELHGIQGMYGECYKPIKVREHWWQDNKLYCPHCHALLCKNLIHTWWSVSFERWMEQNILSCSCGYEYAIQECIW